MAPRASTKTEPLFYSIVDTAHILAMSPWSVKDLLKRKVLRARKAGRRTLVEGPSVQDYAASLPAAKYMPPRRRRPA
jgi:hypothetical protein